MYSSVLPFLSLDLIYFFTFFYVLSETVQKYKKPSFLSRLQAQDLLVSLFSHVLHPMRYYSVESREKRNCHTSTLNLRWGWLDATSLSESSLFLENHWHAELCWSEGCYCFQYCFYTELSSSFKIYLLSSFIITLGIFCYVWGKILQLGKLL